MSAPQAPGTAIGCICAHGRERLGLKRGIPFAVGSLDHHTAAIGAGLGRLAPVSESTGTVLAALRLADAYLPQPDYCVGPGVSGAGYYQLAFDLRSIPLQHPYYKCFRSYLRK